MCTVVYFFPGRTVDRKSKCCLALEGAPANICSLSVLTDSIFGPKLCHCGRCIQNDQPSHLARYVFTQANVTVLRLMQSHVPEKMFTQTSTFSRVDYASVHDSLLTLYHAVRLHHKDTTSCQWAGSDYIISTLHQVSLRYYQLLSG